MFREILSIFRGETPLKSLSQNFKRMLTLAQDMILEASVIYWDPSPTPGQIKSIYERDVEVNKLERAIRKQVATHLTLTEGRNVPYCLLMMSLVKDVERLGDYAKNLAEASQLIDETFPEDGLTRELGDIRGYVEKMVRETAQVFVNSDRERATELTVEGRSVAKRCDELIRLIARSQYSAGLAVQLSLGTRYYKRIGGHVLNILSSVIMPLHKLDYYDEDVIDKDEDDE